MKKRDIITKEAIQWYMNERQRYIDLCDQVTDLLKKVLLEKNILYNDMSYRAKEIDSFKDKCFRKKYANPMNEIYDMAGIRITTYTTAEVKRIKEIIEENFLIDNEHCSDKSETIEVDRFGYLSVHYIAEFKDDEHMPELKQYKGMKFEIQVRTLLQHAWSEVEHDRNYKFNGVLPKDLKRRFYRLAGILELVDDEFESLAKEVEGYKHFVETEKENLELNIMISRQSIVEYFSDIYDDDQIFDNSDDEVIRCLKVFGVETIEELDRLYDSISEDNISEMLDLNGANYNVAELARDILIVKNAKTYFDKWGEFWGVDEDDIDYFKLFGVDITPYIQVINKQGMLSGM